MGETNTRHPLTTLIVPPVAEGMRAPGVRREPDHSTLVGTDRPEADFVVRVPRGQSRISITLNTRRLAEQRAIRRQNEANRNAGR